MDNKFFAISILVIVSATAILTTSVAQYWSYHNELRKQGVIARYAQAQMVYEKISELPPPAKR